MEIRFLRSFNKLNTEKRKFLIYSLAFNLVFAIINDKPRKPNVEILINNPAKSFMIQNKYNKQFSMSLIQCHGGIKELVVVGGNAARSEGGQLVGMTK